MFSTVLFLLSGIAAAFLLPGPTGKFNVTLTTGPLADYTRRDPETGGPRILMVSVFEPATCDRTVPASYMPNKTAEYQGPFLQEGFNISANLTPLFENARLPVCSDQPRSTKQPCDHPILLFSPGYSVPRFYYNVIVSAIASQGFTVISMDHPEDQNIINYPDGHAVYNNGSSPFGVSDAEYLVFQNRRVTDFSFVIDQLTNASAIAILLPHRGRRPFATDRIAAFGHSLGGTTSLSAAEHDSRIRGAINWDGTIEGSPQLSKPVLLVSESGIENISPTWNATWLRLTGPKLWLMVNDTSHYTFSDVATLLQAAGQDLSPYADLLNTIEPSRLVRILAEYTAAWMNGVFAGKIGGPLLQGEERRRFPEVSAVLKANF